MNWLYLIGGGVSLLLLAYLSIALLKPEKFSFDMRSRARKRDCVPPRGWPMALTLVFWIEKLSFAGLRLIMTITGAPPTQQVRRSCDAPSTVVSMKRW